MDSEKAERLENEIDNHFKKRIFGIKVALHFYSKKDTNNELLKEEWYAELVAKELYILLIDEKRNKSLIKQLNKKEELELYDTASQKNSISNFYVTGVPLVLSKTNPYMGLVAKDINDLSSYYVPLFYYQSSDKVYAKKKFNSWLNQIIYEDSETEPNIILTRKDLISFVRHQDAGGHVDSKLDSKYSMAKRSENSIFIISGIKQKLGNSPIYSSLMQIGWEVLESLKEA